MTEASTYSEAVRQLLDGDDVATAEWMCENLPAEVATRAPEGGTYSIATVVYHTWIWVRAWNIWIRGDGDPFPGIDMSDQWPAIGEDDWPGVRDRLHAELRESARLAGTCDPDRVNASRRTNGQCILQITIHTAYHFGQIALILQDLGLWRPD